MPLFALAAWLPQTFWLLLAAVCLVIVGVSVYLLIQSKKFHQSFLQTISAITESLGTLERCRIENLEAIRDDVRSEQYPLITAVGEKLISDSDRLYQGKWIGDPTPLLKRERVLTRSQYRLSSAELPVQVLAVSVLATSLFLLIGLSGTHNRNLIIQISFLPALFGAVGALLLFFRAYRSRQNLDRSLTHLAETITEKVPVFRELAGTAALIESFFRYDRRMADSISRLSSTVEAFTKNEMAKRIADNVRQVMEEQVSPPLQAASHALGDLAEELSRRQQDGMRELAEAFTAELSQALEEHLSPFYKEIAVLTQDLYEANKQSEAALSTMENYKQQSLDLQKMIEVSLNDLAESSRHWNNNLDGQQQSLEKLSEVSAKLADLQSGSEHNLTQELGLLREKFSDVQDSLYEVMQALHLENQKTSKLVQDMSEHSDETLSGMSRLTGLLVDQTSNIERQNTALTASLSSLEEGLNQSVSFFSSEMLKSVNRTLDEFDDGLAELSKRLSNTTAEINDAVNVWGGEMHYAEEVSRKRREAEARDHAEDAETRRALLEFLHSNEASDEELKRTNEARKDGESLD